MDFGLWYFLDKLSVVPFKFSWICILDFSAILTINSLSFINKNIKKIIENVNFCVE